MSELCYIDQQHNKIRKKTKNKTKKQQLQEILLFVAFDYEWKRMTHKNKTK